MNKSILLLMFFSACVAKAASGKWTSQVTGTSIDYTVSQPTGAAATDQSGKPMTVQEQRPAGTVFHTSPVDEGKA